MIAVLRIVGKVKQKKKDLETLDRLNLGKKFTCLIFEEGDVVRLGMVKSISSCVAYGKISEEFAKEIKKKRGKKGKPVCFLHPPIGGFKKSSKVASPRGILGEHEDISKLLERML